jgi:hypothetical protein
LSIVEHRCTTLLPVLSRGYVVVYPSIIVTDAIKYVQGKLDRLNAQREILQDIKEDKAKSEDIDQQETNNDIFCYLHRKATINVHEYLRGLVYRIIVLVGEE